MRPGHTRIRLAAIALVAVITVVAAGCGSSDSGSSGTTSGADNAQDSGTSAGDTSADSAAGDQSSDDSASTSDAKVDPCQWYTAAEMSDLLGFTVTMEQKETPVALGVECLYDSQAEFTSITVRPSTTADYDQQKAGAASLGIGGKQIDIAGVGDEAYHDGEPGKPNPSVALSAKKGDKAITVELAAAGGDTIDTADKAIEVDSTIAKKALG